jgi:hypothetical protein
MKQTNLNRREMLALAAATQAPTGLAQSQPPASFENIQRLLQAKDPVTWLFIYTLRVGAAVWSISLSASDSN